MAKLKLGIIVGSNRRESINRKLAQALARLGGDRFETRFLKVDDLPLYNQDLETELPATVARFKAEAANCDAFLFVTPEHNRSIPALLKNAIDWGSRPYGTSVWIGKPAGTTGTSGGAIASAIAQQHLRQILGNFVGMHVMGGEAYIAFRPELIDAQGDVTDEKVRAFLKNFIDQFAAYAGRFATTQAAAERAA
ncbi:MAG TPA: NADPH-dependent FMN reductase [Pseudolabrys sp.]|nr:NADPH-dependent FMN reductase [Pseudolabrys sp.]